MVERARPTAAAICSRFCSPSNPSCTAIKRSRLQLGGSSLSCFCRETHCRCQSSFCRGRAMHSLNHTVHCMSKDILPFIMDGWYETSKAAEQRGAFSRPLDGASRRDHTEGADCA